MSEKRDQSRREEIRYAVLAYLHARPGVAQSAATICRGLRREYDCTTEDVSAAATFLADDGQLDALRDPLGATQHYRITAKGTRTYEATLV